MNTQTEDVLVEVGNERMRQNELKAAGRFEYSCADIELSNFERLTILMEEVGEACRAALEENKLSHDVSERNLRTELIQIAAVAVACVEGLDNDDVLLEEDWDDAQSLRSVPLT